MYYECPKCGKKFKHGLEMMDDLGDDFGKCPKCGSRATFVMEGPNTKEGQVYEEIDQY